MDQMTKFVDLTFMAEFRFSPDYPHLTAIMTAKAPLVTLILSCFFAVMPLDWNLASTETQEHPHAQMLVEEWDGLDVAFPLPVYLSDETIRYSLRVTNTTSEPFEVNTSRRIDGTQLIWVPYKNGLPIAFEGTLLFHDDGKFRKSPLERIMPHDEFWWQSSGVQSAETLLTGDSIRIIATSNMPLRVFPDAIRPYFVVPGKLLTQDPIPIRVDPRKTNDFPMIEPHSGPSLFPYYEVTLDDEVFLFLMSYRMCRVPTGLDYEIWEKSEERFNPGATEPWIQRIVVIKFPASTEPDFIFESNVPNRRQASDETDPDKWAKRMGFGSSARVARELAKQEAPPNKDEQQQHAGLKLADSGIASEGEVKDDKKNVFIRPLLLVFVFAVVFLIVRRFAKLL